jgi:two-component system, LuxR family, sensor kinase FixL
MQQTGLVRRLGDTAEPRTDDTAHDNSGERSDFERIRSTRTSLARKSAIVAVILAAYLALEWISFLHEYKGVPITPWNPGLGVVFALTVFIGPAGGLVLFAGIVAAEAFVLQTELDWPMVLALAALSAASYAAIGALARQALGLDTTLTHLRDVLVLLAAGLGGALASSSVMTTLLIVAGPLDWRDAGNAWLPLMVGDVIGIAVMTPLLLRLVVRRHRLTVAHLATLAPEALLFATAIVVVLVAILARNGIDGHKLFYLLFLPVVAAALRRGLDGACVALATTQLVLVALLHLHGFDAQVFTDFQTQMLVLTATGLIVGVAVTERRNADRLAREAQMRLKDKEAEAAQAARFNLVSGMASALAHEITQPMTAARALARSVQHILRTHGDLARADANVTTLIAQIDHAGDVLRHVRDFLRRGTPHLSTLDVRTLVHEALTLTQADAEARHVAIEVAIATDLPPVHGDHVQLQQVILNLVRNATDAIAPTGRPGWIAISARRHGSPATGVEIGVQDDGPGIAPDMVDCLFEPLTTSKHKGLGLGLPICASIVTAHGGRIWLESSAPGHTEFRFVLPLSPPSLQ